jgi:hypothetical protein
MSVAARFSFLAVLPVVLLGGGAKADTIFDVEHARANYRAGLTNSDDREFLNRWGRPSGYYPQYGDLPTRRIYLGRRAWRERR